MLLDANSRGADFSSPRCEVAVFVLDAWVQSMRGKLFWDCFYKVCLALAFHEITLLAPICDSSSVYFFGRRGVRSMSDYNDEEGILQWFRSVVLL